jgi:hypothetical protein
MPAPKGNQYAVGHGKGRPRTVCPDDDELIALGEEMIEWIQTNDCVHVSDWYCIEKMIAERIWDVMTAKEVFIPYYDKALKIVGRKYLKEDTGIEPRIKDRWLRSYYGDLRKREDKDKDDDVIRQKSAAEAVPEDVLRQTQAMNQQMAQLRADLSGKGLRLGQSSSEDQSSKQEQP